MKFLHTADWQLGMKAVHAGAAAQRVRDERLAAARRVVTAARERQAEFIVVAGDTFEDNGVERLLVQKAADILASFGGPVFLLPGNHDPLVPGSVWEHPAWSSHANLHVLREAEPLAISGGVLYPCPLTEKYSTRNPTRWIEAQSSSKIAIGVAHGTLHQIVANDDNYPITNDAAQEAGLDYLALGHWHSHLEITGSDGVARLAYSGTHEPTKFGERASGFALMVEIERRGAAPKLTPVPTGGLSWEQWTETLNVPGDVARLRERVERWESPQTTLLELRLAGLFSPSDDLELARIEELLAARFVCGRTDTTSLVPAPADGAWLANLPPGVLVETARRLQAMADSPAAAQALLDLYRLSQEAP
jgi:DNA repair exonuclease SbcCD nuclease subunit